MKIRKYVRKLTPSGAWDNGVWELSNETVEFPKSKLKDAIIETMSLKSGWDNLNPWRAYRVTIDGNSWMVNRNPNKTS